MTEYVPDCWTVIRINHHGDTIYKILAGWSGGYLNGSSWRLNSGVTKVEEDGDWLLFSGSSGSLYRCGKHSYGLRMSTAPIWARLQDIGKDNVILMDEDTDWLNLLKEV